uniref:hypothetical protein n=1 Tax=Cephaleuros karstenii TaxID=1985640 RepID=UPI001EDCB3B3|nr:hypothetical protein MFR52_pgp086 [Cephaleuros karstenii]UIB39073.1 hypothetical protein [Cephaleuros karstenii]
MPQMCLLFFFEGKKSYENFMAICAFFSFEKKRKKGSNQPKMGSAPIISATKMKLFPFFPKKNTIGGNCIFLFLLSVFNDVLNKNDAIIVKTMVGSRAWKYREKARIGQKKGLLQPRNKKNGGRSHNPLPETASFSLFFFFLFFSFFFLFFSLFVQPNYIKGSDAKNGQKLPAIFVHFSRQNP